ncbi:MAG: hypothetical protein WA840_22375, partial [Caulobacteraceae bacterium]
PPADAPPRPPASVSGVTVTARRPTTVTGVTVVAAGWCPRPDATRYPADHDPTVMDSYPSEGSILPPGAATVRVTFDAAMSCDWEVGIEGGDDDPCAKAGAWALPGRRTFLTRCTLAPKTHYVFHFRKRDGVGFVGLSGRPAAGFDLSFDTSDARPTPPNAPSADPRPLGGETVKAYVTCIDLDRDEEAGACQKALIDSVGPPEAP